MMRTTVIVAMVGVGTMAGAQTAPSKKLQDFRPTTVFSLPPGSDVDLTGAGAGAPGGRLVYYGTNSALRVYDRVSKATRDVIKGAFREVATSRSGDQLVLLRPAEDAKPMDRSAPLFVWTVPVNPNTGAATGEPRRVSVIPAEAASFSPDGKQIAFIAKNTPAVGSAPAIPRKMMVIPATGGQERVLFERGAPRAPLQWSPDGQWIYFAQPAPDAAGFSVMSRVSVEGGVPTPMTPPVEFVWPGLAPDGQHIIALTKLTSVLTIATFDLNKQLIRKAEWRLPPASEPLPIGWSGDGLKALVVDGTAPFSAYSVSIEGGRSRSLPIDIARAPTLSPDGKRIALVGAGDSSLWAVKVMNADGSGKRTIRATSQLNEAWWSHDSKYFGVWGDQGTRSFYLVNASTGRETKAGGIGNDSGDPFWRTDSRGMLYVRLEGSNTKTQVSVREAMVDGTDRLVRDLTPALPASGEQGYGKTSILNDSIALMFRQGLVVSLRDGSTRRLYDPVPLSDAQRFGPWMAFDGTWIAIRSVDRKSVDVLTTDGQSRRTIRLPAGLTVDNLQWKQPSKGPLIFSTAGTATTPAAIYAASLDGAAPRVLVTLTIGARFNDITISEDQKTIVYTTWGRGTVELGEVDLGVVPPTPGKR